MIKSFKFYKIIMLILLKRFIKVSDMCLMFVFIFASLVRLIQKLGGNNDIYMYTWTLRQSDARDCFVSLQLFCPNLIFILFLVTCFTIYMIFVYLLCYNLILI